MWRQDTERQMELEPQRIEYAKRKISELGYAITHEDGNSIQFVHAGKTVTLYPYSGWFSGKTVRDGRGLHHLLQQLKNNRVCQSTQ